MNASHPILVDDFHVHLYGCLDPEDVWELGKDRWQEQTELLSWYESEYEKAWGIRPKSHLYWQASDGLERLRKDYLFGQPADFPRFQACFNLVIALFKIRPQENFVLQHVLNKHESLGLRHVEYRTILPPWFTHEETDRYLTGVCETIDLFKAKQQRCLQPYLAFTISRENSVGRQQYQRLRKWIDAHPHCATIIKSLDFAYDEEDHPPHLKKEFFAAIQKDNLSVPAAPLNILYHVGESYRKISLMSSIRWVWQAAKYGADRLGHCISLGVDPRSLKGQQVEESRAEFESHREWLVDHRNWLQDRGFPFQSAIDRMDHDATRAASLRSPVTINYDNVYLNLARMLQDIIMGELAVRKTVIESCPTSNIRIANLGQADFHPLKRFLNKGLSVCLASDDPGIFATSLANEERFCRDILNINTAGIKSLHQTAEQLGLAYGHQVPSQ
jgi:hypothetical protein